MRGGCVLEGDLMAYRGIAATQIKVRVVHKDKVLYTRWDLVKAFFNWKKINV